MLDTEIQKIIERAVNEAYSRGYMDGFMDAILERKELDLEREFKSLPVKGLTQ
jgi:hypothetical protein